MDSKNLDWDRGKWGPGKQKDHRFKYSTPKYSKVDKSSKDEDNDWRKKGPRSAPKRLTETFNRNNNVEDEKIWSRGGEVFLNSALDLLKEMSQEDYEGTISERLLEPQFRIADLLNNNKKLDLSVTLTIIKIILKDSEENLFEKYFRTFFSLMLGTTFASSRVDSLINVDLSKDPSVEILIPVIQFLKLSFVIMPGLAYDLFYTRVENLQVLLNSPRMSSLISPEITCGMTELHELASSSCPTTSRMSNNGYSDLLEPPNNFRLMSIFPSRADLVENDACDVFLRQNKDHGAYLSVNHYLDVQFRLMHEDFVRPLREGVVEFRKNKVNRSFNIRVYKKVSFIRTVAERRSGIVYQFQLDLSRLTNIDWSESKRFINGSLLCLSYDNFETFVLATVKRINDEDIRKGVLSVIVVDGRILDYQEYSIIESTILFESYRYVLAKLQKMTEDDISMKDYIVYGSKKRSLPLYLERNKEIEYGFINKVLTSYRRDRESIQKMRLCELLGEDLEDEETFQKLVIRPCSSEDWPLASELQMNESQYHAFKMALTSEMTIIQGPPGTGKTYLGLRICKCLLNNVQSSIGDFGPILIVCYTNHALDQFLEGISTFTHKIVRIGGGCKSEKIRPFALKHLKHHTTHLIDDDNICSDMEKLEEDFSFRDTALQSLIKLERLAHIIPTPHFQYLEDVKLEDWLSGTSRAYGSRLKDHFVRGILDEIIYEVLRLDLKRVCRGLVEDIKYGDKDFQSDFNYETYGSFVPVKVRSTKTLFKSFLKNQSKMSVNEANAVKSIDTLTVVNRWRLYRFWRHLFVADLKKSFPDKAAEYNRLSKKLNKSILQYEGELIKEQDIIGMTTTIAAKYGQVLKNIRCKIIIVEEAAEVIESHLIASLNVGCEHLILIGDHKQLKPSPAVYELSKNFGMDVSLFERLVNNGIEYTTLTTQHRMRPEISKIMNFIYKDLHDHESVLTYPNVPAVNTNVFFFNHFEPEEFLEDVMSYTNKFEAQFVMKFCNHLLGNGVSGERITILTLYSGQKFHFGSIMGKELCKDVRVAVVDNYQGEENDIILLSLVRSNEYEQIGFLNIENRICVSLSRAKHGLYVFGNFDILIKRSQMWNNICKFLDKQHLMGNAINMFCQNHPEKTLIITQPKDFEKYPNCGCEELCNTLLECGHICPKYCHFLDRDHSKHRCMFDCKKSCVNGHPCLRRCHENCGQCHISIMKTIPTCNHDQVMACHKDPTSSDCLSPCERVLPCSHRCTKVCGKSCDLCLTKVQKTSKRCGHLGDYYCHDSVISCNQICDSQFDCTHRCKGRCIVCYDQDYHEPCQEECGTPLVCGHICRKKCSAYCYPCTEPCLEQCSHSSCPLTCGQKCVRCIEPCEWKCPHKECTRSCQEMCDRDVCDECCTKASTCLSCNFEFLCYGVCGEKCRPMCPRCDPTIIADLDYVTLLTCGHSFRVHVLDEYMLSTKDNGEIVRKTCPTCNVIINKRSCFRYMNVIRQTSNNIDGIQVCMIKDLEDLEYSDYFRIMNPLKEYIFDQFSKFGLENYLIVPNGLHKREWMDAQDSLYTTYFGRDDIWRNVLLLKYLISVVLIHRMCKCSATSLSASKWMKWLNPNNRSFNACELRAFYKNFPMTKTHVPTISLRLLIALGYANDLCNMNQCIVDSFVKASSALARLDFKGKRWFKCTQGHIFVGRDEALGPLFTPICNECHHSVTR